MDAKSEDRDLLRYNIKKELDRYLGYAEDVHHDYITVDRQYHSVDYQPRIDERRNPDLDYYNVLSLIKPKGLWFEPDMDAIEAVVQVYYPSDEVNDFCQKLAVAFNEFFSKETPADLRTCRISISVPSFWIDFYDESTQSVEEDDSEMTEEELFELSMDAEACYTEKMRGLVYKTSEGYGMRRYEQVKLALKYINERY